MKKPVLVFFAILVLLLAAVAGYVGGKRANTVTNADARSAASTTPDKRKVLYWQAPMDPTFRSDKSGKSPMGMDLVPVYASDGNSGEASDVKIDPAVVNNLGVRTAEVQYGALSNRLEAVGYVGYDEDTAVSVNTRSDGWVEKLAVKSVGDAVHSGQLLYELFSPKLATAEREYLTALASGRESLIAGSRERMRSLGFTSAQIEQTTRTRKVSDRVARRADADGVVTSLSISAGAYVTPSMPVMKLADLHTVWILVEIDESQAALLRLGQEAVAEFDAFPGQHWQGTVDYIYPDISMATRTAKVRLRFANKDLRLQPNMYAHVAINTAPHDTVYVPDLAVIRTGRSERVVVALGNGRFDVCPVETGATSGERVEILKGLQAGQRVVISAQFLIDSEANVDAAALRLGSGKSGCTAMAATPASGMPGPDANDGQRP
ncbi:MAG: efflux RND transporter periplasmic adaptor subunit [Rhodanobacteraceae bacterium]